MQKLFCRNLMVSGPFTKLLMAYLLTSFSMNLYAQGEAIERAGPDPRDFCSAIVNTAGHLIALKKINEALISGSYTSESLEMQRFALQFVLDSQSKHLDSRIFPHAQRVAIRFLTKKYSRAQLEDETFWQPRSNDFSENAPPIMATGLDSDISEAEAELKDFRENNIPPQSELYRSRLRALNNMRAQRDILLLTSRLRNLLRAELDAHFEQFDQESSTTSTPD